ncbi:FANCI solenoid 2-domain-containing protein [Cokeromyces recurvatus]|uniref:FANCI solenoid 2-domain-containing protein n=1 Tax=Cokeromyces recurvatus TaxID=90255 RepID=UPI00221FD20B|nr:FANCI solenoid 2-domain-containing protein [Cokeromyces recurvatus]KAI7907432.1 FANCI solenoid 2-domain-containing protein [Cokeromyces recurvatus]
MDKEIFKLSKLANKERLIEYLNDQTEDEITCLVKYKLDDYYALNDVDTTLLLRAIILEDKDKLEKAKQASSVVNLISPEIELLSVSMLKAACKMIIDTINQNKPIQLRLLDILTKIWNVLTAANEYNAISDLFDNLFEGKWHSQIIVSMSSALNDMELSNHQLEIALKQMLNRVEGTVMLHLSFALKQDQDLGNELFKLLKNKKSGPLKLFEVACLLTAARIHRLQDTIFDFLKSSIISVYKDNEKLQKRCLWISEYFPLEANRYGQALLDVAEKSATAGWDQVIQTLCQLATILIDTASNTGNLFMSNENYAKLRSSQIEENDPIEQVAQLGINILLRLFKYHDIIRSEILEQMTSRIVSRANSATNFLKLLAKIIRKYPETVEKYVNNIKDILDILSFLPLSIAEHLLNAIQPLLTTNKQFQEGLILVLRKSLFAK